MNAHHPLPGTTDGARGPTPGRPADAWRFARAALVAAGAAVLVGASGAAADGLETYLTDVSALYLAGSVACGALVAVAGAEALWSGAPATRPGGLLVGVNSAWVVFSAAVAVELLPAYDVPARLPAAYVGYCVFRTAGAWVARRAGGGRPAPVTPLDFAAAVAFAAVAYRLAA